MQGFDSTRDVVSQAIVAAILAGVFALLAADRVHRVLVPIGAVALLWAISYFTPFRLISFETAQKAVDLNVKVDPAIIGGITVKLGSRMVDSSLRTKLNSIKIAMKEAR